MQKIDKIIPEINIQTKDDVLNLSSFQNQKVDEIWYNALKSNRELFDGKLLSLVSFCKSKIIATPIEYKLFYAKLTEPDLFKNLNIQILSVTGLLECPNGYIFGKRSNNVTQFKNQIELIPSGSIDYNNEKVINPINQVLKELAEECGVDSDEVVATKPFLIIHDNKNFISDIVIYLKTNLSFVQIEKLFDQKASKEYSQLFVVDKSKAYEFIKTENVVETTQNILRVLEN